MKIIVVDDEEQIAKDLSQALKEFGEVISIVDNRKDFAIDTIREVEPDVVIVDLQCQGRNSIGKSIALAFMKNPIKFITNSGHDIEIQKITMATARNVRHFCLKNDFDAIKKCIRGECNCN